MSTRAFSYGATASEISLGDDDSLLMVDQEQQQQHNDVNNTLDDLQSHDPLLRKQVQHSSSAGGSKAVIETQRESPAPSDSMLKTYPCFSASIIIIIIISSIILILALTTTVFDSYISRRADVDIVGSDDVTDDTLSLISDTLLLTFKRDGYDILDQFLPDKSTVLKYKFLSTYDGIVEPYASMHLQPLSFDNYTQYDYKYTVCPDANTDTDVECKHGELTSDGVDTPFSVACTPFEGYKVQVTEYYPATDPLYPSRIRRKSDGALMCIYVRRELRTLLESDLNDTMTAMSALWSINEVEGAKMFGDNFHASNYFVQAHEFNSAQQDADHMHEGIGFLPQVK